MSRKISSSSEKPDMGKPKKKKKKKLLNSSFQESLHFFFYRFSFLAAAFVFSAQLNVISESVLGPVARIKNVGVVHFRKPWVR